MGSRGEHVPTGLDLHRFLLSSVKKQVSQNRNVSGAPPCQLLRYLNFNIECNKCNLLIYTAPVRLYPDVT